MRRKIVTVVDIKRLAPKRHPNDYLMLVAIAIDIDNVLIFVIQQWMDR